MTSFTRFIRDVQDHREPVHIVYKPHDRWPLPPNLAAHEKKDAQEEGDLERGEQNSLCLSQILVRHNVLNATT